MLLRLNSTGVHVCLLSSAVYKLPVRQLCVPACLPVWLAAYMFTIERLDKDFTNVVSVTRPSLRAC